MDCSYLETSMKQWQEAYDSSHKTWLSENQSQEPKDRWIIDIPGDNILITVSYYVLNIIQMIFQVFLLQIQGCSTENTKIYRHFSFSEN